MTEDPLGNRQRVATACGVAIVLVAEIIFAVVYARTVGWTVMPILRVAHAAVLVVVLVALLRTPPSERFDTLAGLLATLPLLPVFWLGATDDLRFPGDTDPLVGYRLAIVGAALLMPGPIRLAALMSGLFLLTEALHVQVHRPLYRRERIFAEPWITFFHVVVAALVLFLRARVRHLEAEAIRVRSAAESARIVGDLRRALGDGALTPLQTIEANAFLQRRRHPEEADNADRILRAAARVRHLLDQLRTDEPEGETHELSLDARASLRDRLAAIRRAR